ncbi:MAG TPA: RNA polymerase sigma factor [Baekduia sp.]|uniref:RNA polymerase sigma factor n=1 Tax=Baekduia sp. TaxID=2600305 RepID=UPI002D78AB52|nr:RNA polymerase sigma factor [Baekduia sp.]HET6505760.1 RNA polymerase sigma factor [Baekduia sp.]
MRDADAFAALYDREARTVLVFIARRTLDPEVALDLTAETFAQAFRGRRRFRGTTAMEERAYLFTIAKRQIARYLQRGTVERRALEALGAELPVAHEDDLREIEEAAGLDGLRSALGDELARLSAEQRAALQLRVVEERPYEEVASVLGVSEQTARARVSRGLRALAAALEPKLAAGEDR